MILETDAKMKVLHPSSFSACSGFPGIMGGSMSRFMLTQKGTWVRPRSGGDRVFFEGAFCNTPSFYRIDRIHMDYRDSVKNLLFLHS